MKSKTLILNKNNVAKILTMRMAMAAVKEAFVASSYNQAQMPSKVYLDVKKYNGDFRAMPAFLTRPKPVASVKWVNVHTDNIKKGLPTVMAVIILSDPTTGFPLAIMEGAQVTSFRTGAAGGIAAQYLARKNSSVVALIGCGVQSHTQLLALQENFKIKKVFVWGKTQKDVDGFLAKAKKYKLNIIPAHSVKDCVEFADIVVTTTPSRTPLVKKEWIKKGAHINAIGADAPGKQELASQLVQSSAIIVDDIKQASYSGEINMPMTQRVITKNNIAATIGDVITGKKKGRKNPDEITIFDSTGLATQDAALAFFIYREAIKKKVGRMESFI